MAEPSIDFLHQLLAYRNELGMSGMACLFIWALYKRIVVWGSEFTKLEERSARYEAMAMKSLGLAGTAVEKIEVIK